VSGFDNLGGLMFLKHKPSGLLVEVLTLGSVYDPCQREITGRFHAGEEMQEPEAFEKADLIFPSGESLPVCWLNPHYREQNTTKESMSVSL
jgi:hypothetical protein